MATIRKIDHVILHNRYILYIMFFIALGNLLSFAYVNDYISVSIFVLIAFLTTFFSKNMIVILFVAIAFSNVIKIGIRQINIEGFEDKDEDNVDDKDGFADSDDYVQATEGPAKEGSKEGSKATEGPTKATEGPTKEGSKEGLAKATTKATPKKATSESNTDSSLSLEVDDKEKFGQDKDVVYTSDEQRELDETDRIIVSQERILSSINKYKPLLDTLNGLTKNMSDVKGVASMFSGDE